MIFSISWSNDCLISIVVILLLLLFFALNVSEHDNCFNIVVLIANINKKKETPQVFDNTFHKTPMKSAKNSLSCALSEFFLY